MVITDSAGNVYNVDTQGNVSGPFTQAAGGAPTPANTNGVNANGQVTAFSATGVKVVFKDITGSKYAFDDISTATNAPDYIKSEYKKVGNDYLIYKAVVNQQTDYLTAKVEIAPNATINLNEIVFKTQRGALVPSERVGTTNEFKLKVTGTQTYADEEVLATIKQGEQYKVAGAFKLVHISAKDLNVVLVPMNNKNIPNTEIAKIKDIYKKAGINVNVTIGTNKIIETGGTDQKIEVGNSDILSIYTNEQKEINKKIKLLSGYNQTTYYLLYSDLPPSISGIGGFMALSGQFGYVFSSTDNFVAAHELGHGALGLEHPFKTDADQGKTNFLLDYSIKNELWHKDWKQINDPKFRLYNFQGDSEGELAGGMVVVGYDSGQQPILFNIENSCNQFFVSGRLAKFSASEILKINKTYIDSNGNLEKVTDTSNNVYLLSSSVESDPNDNKKIVKQYAASKLVCFDCIDRDILSSNMIESITKETKIQDGKNVITYKGITKNSKYVIANFINTKDCKAGEKIIKLVSGSYNCVALTQEECEIKGNENQNSNSLFVNNLLKGKIKDEVFNKLNALFSGGSKNSITGENRIIKGRILLTSEILTNNRLQVEIKIENGAESFFVGNVKENIKSDEVVFWIEYNTEGKIRIKHIIAGTSFDQGLATALKSWDSQLEWQQKTFFEKFLSASYSIVDSYFTATYDMLDMLSSGIGKLKIPSSVFDCTHQDYNSIYAKVFSYLSLSGVVQDVIADKLAEAYPEFNEVFKNGSPSQIQFALLCGMYNGLIDVIKSVPDLAKLLVSPLTSKGREANSKFITQIEEMEMFKKNANGTETLLYGKGLSFGKIWYLLKEGIASQFDATKPCVAAEFVGSIVGPIIVMCIGDVAAGTGIMTKVASTAFKAIQLCDKLTDPFRFIGMSFRFVKGLTGKVDIVVKNVASDIITQLDNGLFRIKVIANNTELPNLEMSLEDVNRLVAAGTDGIDFPVNGVNQRIKLIGSTGSVGTANPGTISAQIFGAANEQLLKKFTDLGIDAARLDKVLTALGKTAANGEKLITLLNKTSFKDDIYKLRLFIDDIEKSADLQDFVRAGKDFSKEWKILEAYPSFRKLAIHITKIETILSKGHISADDLTTVLTVNKGLGKRATDLVNFLDDLDHFALYKDKNGFDSIISGLKANWFNGAGADGANWVIAILRKEGTAIFPAANTNFEVIVNIAGNTRRYDAIVNDAVVISNNNRKKYFEFKSYSKVPPTDFNIQFIRDLNNPDIIDLKQLEWLFDAAKNPPDFEINLKKAIDEMDFTSVSDVTLSKFNIINRSALKIKIKNEFNNIFKLK